MTPRGGHNVCIMVMKSTAAITSATDPFSTSKHMCTTQSDTRFSPTYELGETLVTKVLILAYEGLYILDSQSRHGAEDACLEEGSLSEEKGRCYLVSSAVLRIKQNFIA